MRCFEEEGDDLDHLGFACQNTSHTIVFVFPVHENSILMFSHHQLSKKNREAACFSMLHGHDKKSLAIIRLCAIGTLMIFFFAVTFHQKGGIITVSTANRLMGNHKDGISLYLRKFEESGWLPGTCGRTQVDVNDFVLLFISI